MLDNKEALMILDGLYGLVQEIIKNTENKFLKNDLCFYIIHHLKMLLLKHGYQEMEHFNKYNGVILDKKHLEEWCDKYVFK